MTAKERLQNMKADKNKSVTAKDIVEEIIENTDNTQEEIIHEEVKVEKTTVPITRKSVRKTIDRNMEVVIMNNTHAIFTYECPKTHSQYEMSGYGDTDYITVGELLTMKNSHRAIIDNYWILLVGTADEDVELQDVIQYLGLEGVYKDVLNQEEVDTLIMKSTYAKFKKALQSMKGSMLNRVIERTIVLFKEGSFTDYGKFAVVQELTKNDMLLELIKNENEEE